MNKPLFIILFQINKIKTKESGFKAVQLFCFKSNQMKQDIITLTQPF